MFKPGAIWKDDGGLPVHSHGGGLLHHEGLWWWYGEDKTVGRSFGHSDALPTSGDSTSCTPNVVKLWKNDWGFSGVSCYSSEDLVRWKNEGIVLSPRPEDPGSPLHPGCLVERPKVLFNRVTGLFVMWMHMEDATREVNKAGVAVSRSPRGPFELLKAFRPIHYLEDIPEGDPRHEREQGRSFFDMTLFQDTDGSAYVFNASELCKTLHIARLSRDFTDVEKPLEMGRTWTRCMPGELREAPTVFKHGETYHLLTSGCTGYAPNHLLWCSAAHPLGPWTAGGDPCVGPEAATGYKSQPTIVVPAPGQAPGNFIYIGDRWNPFEHSDSRHVVLPFKVDERGGVRIDWRPSWDFSVFSQRPAPAAPRLDHELLRRELLYHIDGIRLTWERVPGADLYRIYRNGAELDATTENFYEPPFALPGVVCVYTVRASNLGGGDSPPSRPVEYTHQVPRPCYLSDHPAVRSWVGYGVMRRDHTWRGNPLRIGNTVFAKGIWMHSRGMAEWDLGGIYQEFRAHAGIDPVGGAGGTARFRVSGNGTVLFESGDVHDGDAPLEVVCPVRGVRFLKLETLKSGAAIAHALWADARVDTGS